MEIRQLPPRRRGIIFQNLVQAWRNPRAGNGLIKAMGLLLIGAALILLAGLVSLLLAPVIGPSLFPLLWGIEPLTYIGWVLLFFGVCLVALAYIAIDLQLRSRDAAAEERRFAEKWAQVTQQYFELFNHDLGRPLRRILGKEREIRELLQSAAVAAPEAVRELLDEIEEQTPSFRLMLSNIQVLIELETPNAGLSRHAVEPAEVVRRIVDRYNLAAADAQKQLFWWSEPTDFGIVHCDSSAVEHIAANLVDNAVRYAAGCVEIGLTRDESNFYIRVWDDGPGLPARYLPYVFDRGWTPEVARREERTSSGLGLFIAHTLTQRYGGDLTVTSSAAPDPESHTAFLVTLPLGEPPARPGNGNGERAG